MVDVFISRLLARSLVNDELLMEFQLQKDPWYLRKTQYILVPSDKCNITLFHPRSSSELVYRLASTPLIILRHGVFNARFNKYRQVYNISRTLVGNKIVDPSDVVGASPVGAAPITSSFSTSHLASLDWAKTTPRRDEKHLSLGIWCVLY